MDDAWARQMCGTSDAVCRVLGSILSVRPPVLLSPRRLASPALDRRLLSLALQVQQRGRHYVLDPAGSGSGRRHHAPAACRDSGSGAYLSQESRSCSEGSRGTHPGRAPAPAAAHGGEVEDASQFVEETPGTGRSCLLGACGGAGQLRKSGGGGRRAPLSSVLKPEPLAGLEIVCRRRPRRPFNRQRQVLDASAATASPPNLLALDPAGGDS